ncbi:MAG: xanthine dehydrogenase family protein subunit M [Thermotogae bacterium]|uniref:Xanthine dehydrogenase family protein subunit M n=1 Tax=Kosmotoga arenicorallina TaxID=688066 RepID=A0A7C5DUL0_9BACT|nr:xanthine dehydrogenase family protein subunit M [Kosmotoga sp.]MBO8166333.1 xanthine dehydrogenase family protein subunit M [Kosmotoga sp.]RKX48585.1 MAG: xanthine dehydrogenase family protein subunit M [Thermotogota bacterium]HHF08225.1 xanthine dehydrogenase family protein subunit M [Kosmotoga arenicorallina]
MGFDVFLPESEDELMTLLMRENAKIMAGGTDLLVRIRAGRINPDKIISLSKIQGMNEITDVGDRIRVGCRVTHSMALNSNVLKEHSPIMLMALKEIGSPQIRNRGTIVGNVVNASPAGDSLIPLYLSNAKVVIHGPKGERKLPIEEFIKGPGKTALSMGEFVRAVEFEKSGSWHPLFYKVGQRTAMAIAIASLGLLIKGDNLRIAFGSVAPTVVRAYKAERYFKRSNGIITVMDEFMERCLEYVSPIDDIRASAWYRKEVIKNLLKSAFDFWRKKVL